MTPEEFHAENQKTFGTPEDQQPPPAPRPVQRLPNGEYVVATGKGQFGMPEGPKFRSQEAAEKAAKMPASEMWTAHYRQSENTTGPSERIITNKLNNRQPLTREESDFIHKQAVDRAAKPGKSPAAAQPQLPPDVAAFLERQGLSATPIPAGGTPKPAPRPNVPVAPRGPTAADAAEARAQVPGGPGYSRAQVAAAEAETQPPRGFAPEAGRKAPAPQNPAEKSAPPPLPTPPAESRIPASPGGQKQGGGKVETSKAKGALPVHMTPLSEYLAEPHEPAAAPDKVTVKKATAKQGGGYLVTVQSGGTSQEMPALRAKDEEGAKAEVLARWRKSQEPAQQHRSAVAEALERRRHVPESVLADYTDLVAKHGRPPEHVLPDQQANRLPGSRLRLSAKAPPKSVTKRGGKLVLDIGPDPRNEYGPGHVIDVGGVPHVVTSASQAARKKTDVAGESHWASNVQDVQARPLTDAERELYDGIRDDLGRAQEAERKKPIFQD